MVVLFTLQLFKFRYNQVHVNHHHVGLIQCVKMLTILQGVRVYRSSSGVRLIVGRSARATVNVVTTWHV